MLCMQEIPAEMFLLDAFRRVFVMQRQQSRLPFPPQPECMLRKMTKAMREQRRIVPEVCCPNTLCRGQTPTSLSPYPRPCLFACDHLLNRNRCVHLPADRPPARHAAVWACSPPAYATCLLLVVTCYTSSHSHMSDVNGTLESF